MKQRIAFIAAMLLTAHNLVFAQRPTHLPYNGEPVGFLENPVNFIVFVVIPLLIIVLYIIWRIKKHKEKKEYERIVKEKIEKEKP